MPTAVETGQVVQVLIQGTLEGQEVQNVTYFRALAPDPDMLDNLLTVIAQCLITVLIPILHPNYRLERLKGKVVAPILGPEEVWSPEAGDIVQSTVAGDALPSYASALISLRTTRGGRSGRGRMFIGGVPESATVSSYINLEGPFYAGLLAFAACMLNNFKPRDVPAAGNYDWGVMSRKLGGLKPPFAVAGYATVTKAEPIQLLATTRSRKQGRGR